MRDPVSLSEWDAERCSCTALGAEVAIAKIHDPTLTRICRDAIRGDPMNTLT
jgi:hypothetical protein